jgi:hypothetical protein
MAEGTIRASWENELTGDACEAEVTLEDPQKSDGAVMRAAPPGNGRVALRQRRPYLRTKLPGGPVGIVKRLETSTAPVTKSPPRFPSLPPIAHD